MSQFASKALPLLSVLVIGITGCSKAVPPAAEWTDFKIPNGKLSIRMPAKPTLNEQSIPTAAGNVNMKLYVCEHSRTQAFLVNETTYPVNPSQFDAKAGLEGAVQGALSNTKGNLISQSNIKINGLDGREFQLKDSKTGAVVRCKMAIDPSGPTIYQVQIVGTKEFVNGPHATTYFDSLKIETGK